MEVGESPTSERKSCRSGPRRELVPFSLDLARRPAANPTYRCDERSKADDRVGSGVQLWAAARPPRLAAAGIRAKSRRTHAIRRVQRAIRSPKFEGRDSDRGSRPLRDARLGAQRGGSARAGAEDPRSAVYSYLDVESRAR